MRTAHVCALRDPAGHEGSLALPARELADLAIRERVEFDALKRGRDGGAIPLAGPARQAHPPVAPGHHHVAHGEREGPVDVLALGDVADRARLPGGRWADPVEQDPAALWAEHPHDRLEERRLARAVHPDEPAHPSRANREARPVECRHCSVSHGDPVDADCCVVHCYLPVSPSMIVVASCLMRSR